MTGERAITITITRTSFKMVIVIMDKLRVKNISSYCDCDGGAMQNSIINS